MSDSMRDVGPGERDALRRAREARGGLALWASAAARAVLDLRREQISFPDEARLTETIADAIQHAESPITAFARWRDSNPLDRPMLHSEHMAAQSAFFAAHPGIGSERPSDVSAVSPDVGGTSDDLPVFWLSKNQARAIVAIMRDWSRRARNASDEALAASIDEMTERLHGETTR